MIDLVYWEHLFKVVAMGTGIIVMWVTLGVAIGCFYKAFKE